MTTSEPQSSGGSVMPQPPGGWWPTPVAHDDGKTPEAHMAMKRRMKGGARNTITSLTVMVKALEMGFPVPGYELYPDPPLMSSAEGFPARTSPMPDAEPGSVESGPVCGLTWPAPFAFYDPDTSSWRTSQPSLFEDLTSSPETWPRSGMTCSGTAYLLLPSAPLTAVTGGGESLPTPRATDADKGGRGDLLAQVRTGKPSGRKHWPTPTARDWKGDGFKGQLPNAVHEWPIPTAWLARRPSHSECSPTLRHEGASRELTDAIGQAGDSGQLNPTWVEWLMGFPAGWTDLEL